MLPPGRKSKRGPSIPFYCMLTPGFINDSYLVISMKTKHIHHHLFHGHLTVSSQHFPLKSPSDCSRAYIPSFPSICCLEKEILYLREAGAGIGQTWTVSLSWKVPVCMKSLPGSLLRARSLSDFWWGAFHSLPWSHWVAGTAPFLSHPPPWLTEPYR